MEVGFVDYLDRPERTIMTTFTNRSSGSVAPASSSRLRSRATAASSS
jgi:hypothetical protein